MQSYLEFIIHTNDNIKDQLIAELSEIQFEGFVESDEGFSAYIPEKDLDNRSFDSVLNKYGISPDHIEKKLIAPQNWNAEWERNFEPIVVADKVRISAPFHQLDGKFAHEIIIQPKNTFGTGHHETTQLILELMLSEKFDNLKVLDYGCGTGVLGIFASMLLAREILGVDIDAWCLDNVRENKQLNGVVNMEFLQGDLSAVNSQLEFNIILANINKNILLDSFERISGLLIENGHLLISGFYESDLEALRTVALGHNLHLHQHLVKNNWCAAQFKFVRAQL